MLRFNQLANTLPVTQRVSRSIIGLLLVLFSIALVSPAFTGSVAHAVNGGKLVPVSSGSTYRPATTNQPNYNTQPSYSPYRSAPNAFQPLQGRVLTAPSGASLVASMQSSISSATANVGDRYTAVLGSDLNSGNGVILPAGTQLEAQVVSVTKAGYAGRNGLLDVRFTSAVLSNGQRVAMSAKVQTQDGTGILKGGTIATSAGKVALRTGLGAGLGAALGTAMGPLSGGRVGRGAIYGTAVGGTLGLLSSAASRGVEAVLPSGQSLNIILDQPLTVGGSSVPSFGSSPSSGYSNQSSGGYTSQPLPPVGY
jgi:hypothetical protein